MSELPSSDRGNNNHYINHTLIIHPSAVGHLGCFHLSAVSLAFDPTFELGRDSQDVPKLLFCIWIMHVSKQPMPTMSEVQSVHPEDSKADPRQVKNRTIV